MSLVLAAALTFATPITVGGQDGWRHDEGQASGYFHTFDALRLAGDPVGQRKVHVFLPRSYGQRQARYPVVYMQDGGKVFFRDAGQSWDLPDRLSDLYRDGRVHELIVVGINTPDRDAEYTHAPVPTVASCCDVVAYADYVADSLKPFIDAHYRTDASGGTTAIVGSSHGGLAAFVTAARHPSRFGFVGAMSPSFWVDQAPFGPGGSLMDSSLLHLTHDGLRGQSHPRVWIDWGLVRSGGAHNAVIEAAATERGREMAALLQRDYGYRIGRDVFTFEAASGGHDEASWGRRVGRLLEAFAGRRR